MPETQRLGGWIDTKKELPPEGVEVEVWNGGVTTLVRKGNLWFLPDFSMYVYFTPHEWRPMEATK